MVFSLLLLNSLVKFVKVFFPSLRAAIFIHWLLLFMITSGQPEPLFFFFFFFFLCCCRKLVNSLHSEQGCLYFSFEISKICSYFILSHSYNWFFNFFPFKFNLNHRYLITIKFLILKKKFYLSLKFYFFLKCHLSNNKLARLLFFPSSSRKATCFVDQNDWHKNIKDKDVSLKRSILTIQ